MKRLFKADFFRIFTSKITLISLILVIAFPLFNVLLFKLLDLIFAALESSFSPEEVSAGSFTGEMIISSTFSLSNNLGFVIPIFSGLFVCMDVTTGSLRNKIISGHKRNHIYFSHLLTSILFNVIAMALYALFTLLFTYAFYDFESSFDQDFIKTIICWFVSGLFTYLFVGCFTTYVGLISKNSGITILSSLVFCLIFGLIVSLLTMIPTSDFDFLLFFVPTYSTACGLNVSNQILFEGIASSLFFGGLLSVFGLTLFKKNDIK